MKKILHINVTYKTASTGKIIYDILGASENSEFQFKVFFQMGNNQDLNSFQYENKIENFIRRGTHKFFGNLEFVTITETLRLIKQIKKYNPDLIHIHTIHHQCLNYKLLFRFLKNYNKPILFSMHDCWLFTGGCYHYTKQGCMEFQEGCLTCPKKRSELECRTSKTHSNLIKKKNFFESRENIYFVAVSDWLCNQTKGSILCNKPVERIYNGINTEIFYDRREEPAVKNKRKQLLDKRKYVVLAIASQWGNNKGLDDIFKLAHSLKNDYQVVLVGKNKRINCTESNVLLYGSTDNSKELAQIYNSADVLVNLSLEETFGLITVEAACCGTPVIAYNSTANGEIINLIGGKLINDVGNLQLVEAGIREICTNHEKNKVDIEVSRKLFSKERMGAEYIELYSEKLERKRRE